jgi:ribosomal protein L11 methyltransferase
MNKTSLWKVSISTTAEAEDAVGDLLQSLSGQAASSYTDVETGTVSVSVFLRQPAERLRRTLEDGLARVRSSGLRLGPGRVRVQRLRPQNWAESWKRHFKPLRIGGALLIKPGWSKCPARRGQVVVTLDPGLSFGTGQHPTTAFCLAQLVRRRHPGVAQSFLDLGTGSGILAIAAARLGYAPIEALDFDPDSVSIARLNAARNRVARRIRFRRADVRRLPVGRMPAYDVVCANLISTVLMAERRRIAACVRPTGVLVLAGILETEFEQVKRAYRAMGFRLVRAKTVREWRSGMFGRVTAFVPGGTKVGTLICG